MSVPVDKILKLAKQGYTDAQIIKQLRQQGYSPRQINDAFNQAKVKLELNKEMDVPEPSEEMQQSMATDETADYNPEEQESEVPVPEGDEPVQEETPAETEAAPTPQESGESYPYQYPSYPARASTEDVEELVDEVVDEKWQQFRKKTGNIEEVKDRVDSSLRTFNKKLDRNEAILNKLVEATKEKFKEQNNEIRSLSADVAALKETLKKIMNPLIARVKKEAGMMDVHEEPVKQVKEDREKSKKGKLTEKKKKPTIDDVL